MLHASLVVERLRVGGRELAVDHATVVVVARAESAELDWEVVAHTSQVEPLARGTHDLDLRCVHPVIDDGDPTSVHLEALALSGPAFLVRSVERALVLRGAGPLAGFDRGRLGG